MTYLYFVGLRYYVGKRHVLRFPLATIQGSKCYDLRWIIDDQPDLIEIWSKYTSGQASLLQRWDLKRCQNAPFRPLQGSTGAVRQPAPVDQTKQTYITSGSRGLQIGRCRKWRLMVGGASLDRWHGMARDANNIQRLEKFIAKVNE